VPVITTKGTPWGELLGEEGSNAPPGGGAGSSGRCGWWIDIGVEPLARALEEAMGLTDDERRAMGENGRRLVEARYTWEQVGAQMEALIATAGWSQ
jgi:glycosyltransferase involved in cell wall biosynthesis